MVVVGGGGVVVGFSRCITSGSGWRVGWGGGMSLTRYCIFRSRHLRTERERGGRWGLVASYCIFRSHHLRIKRRWGGGGRLAA